MTENQKMVLSRLSEKIYWMREDAEAKCARIYSKEGELIRGFATMSNNGLLCLNKDGHSKIIGLWVTDAGVKIAKQFAVPKEK